VLPVLIHYSGEVLVDPTDSDLVELMGFKRAPTHSAYDLVIVGAGPSGLSAAVYASSEGLPTVIVDPPSRAGKPARAR
jgi:thioredoxin reductase (NADPH)